VAGLLSNDGGVDDDMTDQEHDVGIDGTSGLNRPATPPQPAAVNFVAFGTYPVRHRNHHSGTATAAATPMSAPRDAGDGDLVPPRFNGDQKVDAEEWLQDRLD